MKGLLQALKTRIATQVTYLGGEKAVHLVPDEDAQPETTPYPCVGLKDGSTTTHHYVDAVRAVHTVDIVCYVLVNAPEGALIGQGTQKGVLDLTDDVKAALVAYDPTGYRWDTPDVEESPSQFMVRGDDLVQKKKFTMRWKA